MLDAGYWILDVGKEEMFELFKVFKSGKPFLRFWQLERVCVMQTVEQLERLDHPSDTIRTNPARPDNRPV